MTISYALNEEDKDRINREFFESYDHKYWFYKLKTNRILVDNLEEFIDEFAGEVMQDEPVEDIRLSLQSEAIYDFFHTTEALFSLFIANRVSHVPWRKMRHLGVNQICDFIRNVVLNNGLSHEDIRFAFYRGVGEEAIEESEEIRESVEFIETYLKTVGIRFLDNELYNEYKHGLRVVTSRESVTISNEETEKTVFDEEGTVHTYLQSEQVEKDGSDEIHQLIKVTEWFDYEIYHNLCLFNYHMIKQMFDSLRQNLRGGDAEGMIDATVFDYELEDLFQDNEYRLTEKHRYPLGENLYELG
ncbi:hypothetical protein ELS19_11520 [Halogeometricum borinquense]|uniref:Uncharacterized protein n=1 Tax=Halogeometricum borinquense TaxID=60847 RepID=A0A482TRE1_9EURY|nr:hypothetical protein [Halogeometricum borinquense]RYJ14519.1 hypothetical protein ELS19_11520 [Halogeometricum borinquense]